MPPPTQQSRPFFSNFLAAFRSSQLSSTPIISNTSSSSHQKPHTHSHSHSHSHSQSTPSQPRQISTSTKPNATSNAIRGIDRTLTNSNSGSSPIGSYDSSPSPGASSYLHQNQNASSNPNTTNPTSPPTSSGSNMNQAGNGNSSYAHANKYGRFKTSADRRGSDSSSEGFRDVIGKEKWYIGGRTQGGEERYFQLGVVRRRRSGGEMSLDRLSL
ncbi:hypothetical protein SS1G_13973 [Sclerotinia sclerotiorum 1980 UF-70]|uniref:Uncharacterized protein n=2 Tax=Sclerotinia sclerotiorum (strain ATCC 18683 / 1980 / Ss-1) TaxID=665079 RepID=A7F8P2_SCLS1|nr:hypothetical protein SS1G_13973 [Sclerotinia sclerotiorum 1980 UF-70]APA13862.1 hypothetical protein sscle_11g086320 [Sclerotinia sclerotiorum 1980 UF-70]EDN99113.1 hypothetical protein SS1G_13973 [Sclerotinia sclerotiorum 1980 UF-70]